MAAPSSVSSSDKFKPIVEPDSDPGLIISSSVSSKPKPSSSSSILSPIDNTTDSSSSSSIASIPSSSVASRPVSNPTGQLSSSSSKKISGPVSVASVPSTTVQVPIAPGISAPAAIGTNLSNIELTTIARTAQSIVQNNEISKTRINVKPGIISSSLTKLDFVNIFYNKGFPSDANHAELFYPTRDSNPYFVLSSKSLPEEIKLDIISFSELPTEFDKKTYSGNFVFSQNPFSVKISDGFFVSNKEKYERDIVKFLDYNRNKSILNIKLQDIYRYVGRLFPFEIKLNFVDSAVSSIAQDLNFDVIKPKLSNIALENFDSLSVGVQHSKDRSFGNFFYIREIYKFIPETVMSIQGSEFTDCNNTSRNLAISDYKHENVDGVVSSINMNFNFREVIPYAFPLFYIKDRQDVYYNSPVLNYLGSKYALNTEIRHTNYNIGNQLFFYDQIIERYIAAENADGSRYSRNHAIFSLQDYNKTLIFDYDANNNGESSVNHIEFRREYHPDELNNEDERNDYDANYFMYINATGVSASVRMSSLGDLVINKKIKDPISCRIGYFIESDNKKIKDNFNIKIYAVTSVGPLNNSRVFSRSMILKWSPDASFPYGKYYTYGSGKNSDNAYELQCFTIKDFIDILSSNIAGNISVDTPKGESTDICNGLFPTLKEINSKEYQSDESVITFVKSDIYNGFYLMPLSRLWLGNEDNSIIFAKQEVEYIEIDNISKNNQRKSIYSLGLERNIDLSNFCIASPLARKVGRLKVRHEVKTFEEHVRDNDFNTKAKKGKSDSRFYKYYTVRDFVNILREGFSYFYITNGISPSTLPYLYGRKAGSKKSPYGSQKKLIGLSQLGIPTPYYSANTNEGDNFHKTCPSYILSGFSDDNPNLISDKSINKYINDLSSVSGVLNIVYKNSYMFPNRISSFQPIEDYLTNFSFSEFYPYGGVGYGGNCKIFLSTGSDDGYTRSNERLSRNYIPGSSYLLDLFNHDKDKQIIIEGGEIEHSQRDIGISPCYDTGSIRASMVPNSDFIRNELVSLSQASGNLKGNISSTTKSSGNGFCNVNGTGELSNNYSIVIRNNSLELLKDLNNTVYENQIRHFIDIMQNELGDRSNIKISSNYSLNSELIPEYMSIEYRYINPYINSSSSTSSINFFVPDEYEPYGFFDEYNYLSNNITNNNFILFDPYEPYSVINENESNIRDTRFTNINQRQIATIKILEKKQVNKTYKFPLNKTSSYSLSDLIIDVNKTMSPLGVSVLSLVNNPGRFSADKLNENEVTILDTQIRYVNDLFRQDVETIVDKLVDEYDPYFVIDPYDQYTTNSYLRKVRTKQKQKTIYDATINGSVQAAIESESVYSARVKISPYEKSSGLSFMDDNTEVYESSVYLTRPRYNSTVNELLKNQNIQSSLEPLNVSDLPVNNSTLLVPNFEEKSNLENIANPLGSDSNLYKEIQAEQALAAAPPDLKSLQFAYAGSVIGNQNIFNNPPNTFFENGTNIFGDIEFNTKESDFVLIAARVRLNDTPFLYPQSNDSLAYNDFFSSIICRVEYSTGEAIEVLNPVDSSVVNSDLFVQEEEILDTGQFVSIKPVIFKVPLKGLITYITFYYSQFNVIVASGFVKILNAPNELDQFGFLAINNTNSRFSMISSKISKTFGLVLDNAGSWDILVSPEASLSRVIFGDFDLPNGSSYARTVIDTEERFILGIGNPIINADNDITGFDTSGIPPQVLDNITLLPVPNYQQVWILKIQSGLKAYLSSIRANAGSNSLEGCYVDIPIYARGMISGSEGTANVRIFYDVNCVFDYTFCEFFWNLGSPLLAPGSFKITNQIDVVYEELIDCTQIAERIPNTNQIKIYNYSIININKIPMLDNGTSLLLLKSQADISYISKIFWPSSEILGRLKKIPINPPNTDTPWDYDCQPLTPDEINTINKTIIYTNPNDLSIYETNLVTINEILKTANSYMLIQPRINFPPEDDGGKNYSIEKVISSVGFVFKNWRASENWLLDYKVIFGFESIVNSGASNLDIFVPMTYKYYYNEDRQVK